MSQAAALSPKPASARPAAAPAQAEAGAGLGPGVGVPAYLQLLGAGIQRQVTVGAADHPLEHEADRVAQAAAAPGGSAAGSVPGGPSCACGGTCSTCAAADTARRTLRRSATAAAPSAVPSALPAGEAAPLSGQVRDRVEPLLGADLSGVQVHAGPEAARSAQALNARAYTHANHIWLGPNERSDDVELLAHEATHVVQQSKGGAAPDTLQRKPAGPRGTNDGEAPRQRIMGRLREELGDDADAVDAASRPRVPHPDAEAGSAPAAAAADATPAPASPAAGPDAADAARAPSEPIDRGELAARKGELVPEARPDIDRPAEMAPQVEQAAQQTTEQAEKPAEPAAAEAAPQAGAEGGQQAPPAMAAAEQAASLADVAFGAAGAQVQPPDPPALEPPRPVAAVDARGAPVQTDPAQDDALVGVAEQAQTLRLEGLNLRQHASEERANAERLRGNLGLVAQGVGQAEQGVATSTDHLEYRRSVAETAKQSLDASKAKAQTVAEQAPGFAEQADAGKAQTGPMASEATEMAGESAANTPDDEEAAANAQEQAGKINQVNSDISSTDDAIGQTQERAATLQQDAAHAAELNTATEQRLVSVDATLASTESKLATMSEQNGAARGQMEALNSQPDEMLAQAEALDQQGQQMIEASMAIEQRLHAAQDSHESALQSLPEIRPAAEDAEVQALPASGAGAGVPEDYRYEDRENVDLGASLPSWFSGADPVSAEERAQAEERERARRAQEVQEITDMAGGDVAAIGPGQRAWIALRMTGRHLFGSVSGIRWPGWGHLALGLIDPRGPLMGVVSGLSMMLSGGANLLSGEQWRRDPLGNLLKSAADIATGLTIILGSITALAGVIIAIMGAITLLSLGTAAPVTGPIIAFCASVMATVGGWTLTVGEVALVLQGLVLIKNLIDAACAQTAEQLQNQSDKITSDVGNAGNVVLQMGMAKLAQVGGRAMQAEIAEAGGGINFARTVGGVRTTGAGSYARAVGGVARAAPGRVLRGAASLATSEGRSRLWGGIRGMFGRDGPEAMPAREGFSRDFLVGRSEPVPAVPAAEGAAAAPRVTAPTAEAGAAPHPTEPATPAAAPHTAEPTAPRAAEPTPARPAEPATPTPAEPTPPAAAEPTPARPAEPAAPAAAEQPRPAEPTAAEPRPAEPAPAEAPARPVEPESGAAREASLEASGHVESRELTPQQLANETRFIEDNPHLVQEGPPRNVRIGEHEWTENPGGGWCRHSNGTVCVPRLRVDRGPQLTPENVDDVIAELRAKRTLTAADEARLRAVAEQEGGIWNLRGEMGEAGTPALRGEVGHQLLGEDLPYATTIDSAPRIDPSTGLATEVRSIKTHQLYAFQEEGALQSQLEAEARELSRFRTTRVGGTAITTAPGADRVLVIGVPPNSLEASAGSSLTAQWRAEAQAAMAYAARLRPPVRIVFRTIR